MSSHRIQAILPICFAICSCWLGTTSRGQNAATAADASAIEAIQRQIDSYVAAFNAGDADALVKHWTSGGELLTSSGVALRGHDALRAGFADYFAEAKSAKIELFDPQIEILSPSVARETGTARVMSAEQEPSDTVYEAIYLKSEAGWRLDSVREQSPAEDPPSNYEQLRPLEWMVGSWVDQSSDAQIETTCRWTTNRNFLVRSFSGSIQGRVEFEGTQVIGWDPSTKQIRSWMFDSDGGFGTGVWNGSDDGWTVHTLNVLADGQKASATHVYVRLDENSFEFRSTGRQVGGELLPRIEPIVIVRQTVR